MAKQLIEQGSTEQVPQEQSVPTLDSIALELKVEPWKVAAIKAKHKLYGNSELTQQRVEELVADVEGIRIGVPPEAPKKVE